MMKFRLKLFFIVLLLNVGYSYQENTFNDEIKKDNGDQQVSNENVELTSKQVCTPHEVKMEDCNRCRCAANGIGWFCTRKACPPKPLNRRKRSVPVNSPDFRCTPGETFMDDCNTCWCHKSGKLAVCTLMACDTRKIHKRDTNSVETTDPPEPKCTPGESFMDDCNRCWCDETGAVYCTMMGCPKRRFFFFKREISANEPTKPVCKPGDSFMDGCNRCWCDPTGTHFLCTQRGCGFKKRSVASGPPSSYCTPGESFMEDCNRCICHESGNFAACTMMACESKHIQKREVSFNGPPNPPPMKCTPGESFMIACNRCWCDETGTRAACTLKGCLQQVPPYLEEKTIQKRSVASSNSYCTPGEFYMDDCNSCVCHKSGEFASCTMMACPPKHQVKKRFVSPIPPPPGMSCTPGDSFQEDCNTCWCDPSGQYISCTEMMCNKKTIMIKRSASLRAEVNSPDFKCTPGETFMEDCNTCTCMSSGREAACTLMYCPIEKRLTKRDVDANGPTQAYRLKVTKEEYHSPSFTCEPGENFKLDCNTCKCNDDGKSALWCTRIGCLRNFNFQNEIPTNK